MAKPLFDSIYNGEFIDQGHEAKMLLLLYEILTLCTPRTQTLSLCLKRLYLRNAANEKHFNRAIVTFTFVQ